MVLVVDVALSIAIGLARGFPVLGIYGPRHGATTPVTSDSVLVMLGLTLLIQNATVLTRCSAQVPVA